LRKKAAMNMPEPSGSSPPEKPPGSTSIWARDRASRMRRTLSASAAALRLRTITVSAAAGADDGPGGVVLAVGAGKTGMTASGVPSFSPRTMGARAV
jgi:hypothetical protein